MVSVPVIVLSVRAQEGEKVALLDAGANDYLTKPFGVQELAARIRVLLRAERDRKRPNRSRSAICGSIRSGASCFATANGHPHPQGVGLLPCCCAIAAGS